MGNSRIGIAYLKKMELMNLELKKYLLRVPTLFGIDKYDVELTKWNWVELELTPCLMTAVCMA